MKLGMLSAILAEQNFEEVISIAKKMGYRSVEVACWPKEKAERRYAGVSHIDVKNFTEERGTEICDCCQDNGIEIAALAYYPNYLDHIAERRKERIEHLYLVIDAAAMLNCHTVTTFIGRDHTENLEENMKLFSEIWPQIIQHAEYRKVRIAIENCPMLFDETQWPGGQNLAYSPVIWREMFRIIPSEYFGLCYDPSHFIWQQMDYLRPLEEFKDKIFHVHCKDIKVDYEKLREEGVLAYPLRYMSPKIPGLGDVDWGKFVSKLTDIGYQGHVCAEIEDRAFEKNQNDVMNSLKLTKKYLEQFII